LFNETGYEFKCFAGFYSDKDLVLMKEIIKGALKVQQVRLIQKWE
jgi:hypothetical protein